ncbi:Fe-S cluster assembly protein SufD [Acetobacter vaccinii]|uniref:Fe-S cluster assembly protein SufD n=1 Tax=Acetobacter vaccinii TaxID=2592655 RepID=A0A5C1YP12_9PROT|nr:Fe-S cluster assembly protein SufD [Acetobacter vaccinii]QEO18076.1 Fe-S cluster assembly protein SufD [Acetobacter vaccinii]
MNAINQPRSGGLALFADRLQAASAAGQQEAVALLERTGLPDRHVEEWKYTALRPLGNVPYQAAPVVYDAGRATALLQTLPGWAEALAPLPKLVLVNGVYAPALSQLPEGVEVTPVSATAPAAAIPLSVQQPLVALNAAMTHGGLNLHVREGVDAGQVLLVSLGLGEGEPTSFHPRHTITLDKGARLSVLALNLGDGAYFHNPVLDIHVAERAELKHLTVQQESAQAVVLGTVHAHVAEHGVYDSFTLTLGGLLTRYEAHATLAAPRAAVHINGAQRLSGRQVGDITSVITHAAPDCVSRQTVRNVLDGHARGVFQGKVLVKQVAQKTDGYQMNQALLLSADAEIDAKPELEIYADDVRCSHGATVGALDDEQLFYLRSRGVPEADARQILIDAFLEESLSLVGDDVARDLCRSMIAQHFRAEEA